MLAAPFLWVDYTVNGNPAHMPASMGLFGLIYMGGWMISIIGLYRMGALGFTRASKRIVMIQLAFLSLAQGWNIMVLAQVDQSTTLFFVLDKFWPLSNLFMIATGITVVRAGALPGIKRWIPLIVGLWLPISIILLVSFGQTPATQLLSGLYSATTWAMMGWILMSTPPKELRTRLSRRLPARFV